MTRTPIADKRIAELEYLAADAKCRGASSEASYRMAIVGWTVIRELQIERLELQIERFVMWLNRKLER